MSYFILRHPVGLYKTFSVPVC